MPTIVKIGVPGVPKTDPLGYFDYNFGKYGPILTIFSLLQQEIYYAQKLSYFSHLTLIMLPLNLALLALDLGAYAAPRPQVDCHGSYGVLATPLD